MMRCVEREPWRPAASPLDSAACARNHVGKADKEAGMVTWQTVADVVIALLAEDAGRTPDEVRGALAAAGDGWPIDSLLLVEILQRVEETFAMSAPETVEAARSFTSVKAFSEMIAAVAASAAETVHSGGAA